MNEIKYILEQLRKTKTIVIIILLVAFVLFYYKPLITEVVTIKVKKPDEVKKDLLLGQTWDDYTFFNPTLDADNQWFVSQEEVKD